MQKIYFRGVKITSLVMFFMARMAASHAADLPEGGQVVAGSADISQSTNNMTITQNTNNVIIDWQSFSIGQNYGVNFIQPDANSVALNRVIGSDVSSIQGSLTANGHVFIVNPNGVLFSKTAQVDVGGLVATTMNISNENFLSAKYTFAGTSSNAVINDGNINIVNGGTVALIAAKIINHGNITADEGNIFMAAGNKVTLDLGGAVKIAIDEGALETLIEQGGAIRADGGTIYLTTKAADELSTSVINHTGISRAQTLASGKKGKIILLGDMNVGSTKVAGTLDASAPNGGDGGFIETSAANVETIEGLKINAGAKFGKGGEWLIDPFNYTINSTAAANIVSALNSGTDVTITTTSSNATFGGGSSGNGDITVSSAIAKTAGGDATLTLRAANTIVINNKISSTVGKLNMLFDADNDNGTRNGGGVVVVKEDLTTNGGTLNFGTGATLSIGGTPTLVGGDLYIGDAGKEIIFDSGGGDVTVNGEFIIANPSGVRINSHDGDVLVKGIINSGNKYEKITVSSLDWNTARTAAKVGSTGDGSAIGDSYLATVTSRLENAVVGYTANYATSWLGGERKTGIGTDALWRWTQGPEGLEDSGKGLAFFTQDSDGTGGTAITGKFSNWSTNEPNNHGSGADLTQDGENVIQIVNTQGQWNDLPYTGSTLNIYIKETNYDTADLTVDAGRGTTTFEGGIGGLKPINFTAYNADNPSPETIAAETVVTPIVEKPRDNAITLVQAVSSNSPILQNSTVRNSNNNFTSPSFSQPSSNAGNQVANQGIGSMQVIRIKSEGGEKNNSSNNQNSKEVNFKELANHDSLDTTKIFVVDGGINNPYQNSDQ